MPDGRSLSSTPPRMSVGDALFGELPEDVRARYGLAQTEPKGNPGDTPRNASIKAAKQATTPGARPGAPASPWQLSRASWVEVGKRVFKEISNDRVTSVAGGVTFFGLLSLFPAITALVSIYGLFADRETIIGTLDALNRLLPDGAMELIRDQIVAIVSAPSKALGIATLIGLMTALWTANGGIKALIEALNIAWFERETRGFFKLNLVSLTFTLGGIILICLLIATIAILPAVIRAMPLGPLGETAASLVRWPLMFVVLMGALAALYRWGPDKDDAQWHWISPGAVVATLGLIAASVLFSWYAANFANYNKTYGSLGAVIGLMMWLWIAAIVVMVGAEINSEAERQVQKENGIPLEDGAAKVPVADAGAQ